MFIFLFLYGSSYRRSLKRLELKEMYPFLVLFQSLTSSGCGLQYRRSIAKLNYLYFWPVLMCHLVHLSLTFLACFLGMFGMSFCLKQNT